MVFRHWVVLLFFSTVSAALGLGNADEARFWNLYTNLCSYARQYEDKPMEKTYQTIVQQDAWKEMLRMGFSIAPLVVRASEEAGVQEEPHFDAWISSNLWVSITLQNPDPRINPLVSVSPKTRWDGGRELARSWTHSLLRDLRGTTGTVYGDKPVDRAILQRAVAAQGVFALPTLFEELDNGATDVLPILQLIRWPESDVPPMEPSLLKQWWEKHRMNYMLPPMSPTFLEDHPGCNPFGVDVITIVRCC